MRSGCTRRDVRPFVLISCWDWRFESGIRNDRRSTMVTPCLTLNNCRKVVNSLIRPIRPCQIPGPDQRWSVEESGRSSVHDILIWLLSGGEKRSTLPSTILLIIFITRPLDHLHLVVDCICYSSEWILLHCYWLFTTMLSNYIYLPYLRFERLTAYLIFLPYSNQPLSQFPPTPSWLLFTSECRLI